MVHMLVYGQSNAAGECDGDQRAITSTQTHGNLMLSGGLRNAPYDRASTLATALVPMVDVVSPLSPTVFSQTAATPMANQFSALLLAEDGAAAYAAHKVAASVPAIGSKSIAELSIGGSYFSALMERAAVVARLVRTSGLTCATLAMLWNQGENDILAGTARATYSAALVKLAQDFRAHCLTDTPQTDAPIVIVTQVASENYASVATPTIAMAQDDACAAQPTYIAMGCPGYIFDHATGDWHSNARSKCIEGLYAGLVAKRRLVDGSTTFEGAMDVSSAVRSGDGIDVTVSSLGPGLALDDEWVTNLADGNFGFQVVDSGGSPVTITGVAITDATTVRVACASGGGAGSKLRYGWAADAGSTAPGRTTGPRGCLRDRYGETIPTVTIEEGFTWQLNRWLRRGEWATT